jgi:hypothetical protein
LASSFISLNAVIFMHTVDVRRAKNL